jgi:enoyl-CoA hydratase/carnithine racemase
MPNIRLDAHKGILTVSISRLDKKNSITEEMYKALANAIDFAHSSKELKVILLKADGDFFSAGNDMGDFITCSQGHFPQERQVFRFIHALAKATLPIVVAVQGKAVGIGTTMLLHCDFVLLSEDAQLLVPFVNLALVPEAASTLLLPLRIGYARAFELFTLGEPLSAEKALAWGLANKVCTTESLHDEARLVAERIATKPTGSLAAMKSLMRDAERLVEIIDRENAIFDQRLVSAEACEAFAAFAEKRTPDFARIS